MINIAVKVKKKALQLCFTETKRFCIIEKYRVSLNTFANRSIRSTFRNSNEDTSKDQS